MRPFGDLLDRRLVVVMGKGGVGRSTAAAALALVAARRGSAFDFLDAPGRLAAFIDSRSLRLFTAPGRVGLRLFGRSGGAVFSMMRRATGVDLLKDLSEFFRSFGDMSLGFRERCGAGQTPAGQPAHGAEAPDWAQAADGGPGAGGRGARPRGLRRVGAHLFGGVEET